MFDLKILWLNILTGGNWLRFVTIGKWFRRWYRLILNILLVAGTTIVLGYAGWKIWQFASTTDIQQIQLGEISPWALVIAAVFLLAVANVWRAMKIKKELGRWVWQEQRKLFFASLIVLFLIWVWLFALPFLSERLVLAVLVVADCLVVGGLIVLYLIKSRARNPKEEKGKEWQDPLEQKFGRHRCTIWERPFYPRQRKNAAKGEKKTLLLKVVGSWTAAFVTYGLSVSGGLGKAWAIGGAIAVPIIIYSAIAFHLWILLLAIPLAIAWWIAWAISWPDVYVVADKTDRLLIILPRNGVFGLEWEAQLAAVGFNKLRWGDRGWFGVFGSYADPGVSLGTEETRFLFVGPELLDHMIEKTGTKPLV